jgi:uncharacterized protein (TIGR02271 family)
VQSQGDDNRTPNRDAQTVIPLAVEELAISKRVVETGRVRIARVTHEREQQINELLSSESIDISRRPIGQHIDAMPAVREEGDTIVIPIVEEVLVLERRLILKEEVRVRRVRTTKSHQESVVLRHQEAVVTRLSAEPAIASESPQATEAPLQSNQEE